MPIYRISAPDGNTYSIEGPEGASQQDVIQKVLAQYPESGTPRQPRKGLLADVAGGAENLLNISKTGIAALMGDSNAAAQAGIERQKQLQQKYESGFQPEKILAEYDKGNYLSAAGEALSQVPSAVAGLLPSAGQAAGSAVAGRIGGGALGALIPIPGAAAVGATVGQYAVPFVVNAIQALGGQAQEKAQEQLRKGEQVDVDVAELAPYASANAALNLLGTRIAMPSVFKKAIGQKVAAEADDVARLALLEKATKVAGRGNIETVARGALGFAAGELPTEILQDVVDRAAVGKPLTDEEAMQSYRITALNMVLGAPLGGAVRLQERSGAREQVKLQEQQVQRAQAVTDAQTRTDAAAAKQARLQSPEYAKETEQAYQAALKVKTDLQAQLQVKAKGQKLTDEQKQANKKINAQLKEHAPILKAAEAEYDRVGPILEQARVDEMSPEDYMLEQMQGSYGQGIQRSQRTGAERTLYKPGADIEAQNIELADYATQQIGAARSAGNMDLGSYADYLMQDPKLAQQLVENKIKIPSIQEGNAAFTLSTVENNNLLSGLKMRLSEQEKKAKKATAQELVTRQADLQTQQQIAPVDERMAGFTEGMDVLENLRRTGETNFDYLNPIFEKGLEGTQPVIKVNEAILPSDKSVDELGKLDKLLVEKEQADQDYVMASAGAPKSSSANRDTAAPYNKNAAASAAFGRGNLALDQINALAKDGPVHVQETIAARRAQQAALTRIEDELDKIRTGNLLGKEKGETASGTVQTAVARAERARAEYISAALQEAAIARRAQGRPAMTIDEATKAASELHTALSEWVNRVQALPRREALTEVVTQPAIVRGAETIVGAETEMRDTRPLEERRFGAYHPAVAVIKEQLDNLRTQLANPPRAPQRVETGPLKRQFAAEEATKTAEARGETATTLAGELRRRTEFVRNKMSKMGAMRPAARDALNAAADVMDAGKATREILDTVEPVVDAIVAGRQVTQKDVRAIKEALAATRPTAEEQREAGQQALFPETREDVGYIRATASNFEKSPAVKAGRAAVDAARKLQKRRENKERKAQEEEAAKQKTLKTLRTQIEEIKNATKFFWTRFGGGKFSTVRLAEAYVPFPEAGETPAEKKLVGRGLRFEKLTPKEQKTFSSLLLSFYDKKYPAYQQKIDEAIDILRSGQQLLDTNNALLAFMQDTNASIKMQATEMAKELAPLVKTLEMLQEKKDRVLTKSEQKIVALAGKVSDVRNSYHEAVKKAFDKAKEEATAAREELYAPDLQNAQAALNAANKKLATAQNRIEKMLEAAKKVEGREGEQKLLAAEQETAQALQDEITAAIQNLADVEAKLQETFNGAEFTAQAMLDSLVVSERTKLEKLEGRFNELKAANNTNPLLAQKKAEADAQRAVLAIAETAARRNAEAVAKQQREMQAAVTARQTGTIQTAKGETLPGLRVSEPVGKQKALALAMRGAMQRLEETKAKREELAKQNKPVKRVDNAIKKLEEEIAGYEAQAVRPGPVVEPIEKTTPDSRSAAGRAQAATALMDRLQRAQEKQQAIEKMGELKAQFETLQAEGKALQAQGKSITAIGKQLKTLQAQYAYYKNLAGIVKVAPVAGPVARTQTAAPSTLRTGTASNLKGLEGIEGTGGGTQKNLSQARQVRKLSPAQEAREVLENNVISAEAALKQAKKVTAAAEDRLAAASNTVAREESQAALTRAETNERAKEDALELAKQALLTPAEKKAQAKLEAATQAELDKGDVRFSRGPTANPSTVDTVVAELKKHFSSLSRVKIYGSVADLIKANPQYRGLIPKNARGFVDTAGNKAFLIAENIDKGQALGVLLHEVGAHVGLKNILGKPQYNALVNAIQNWAKKNDGSIESRVAKAALARVEAAETEAQFVSDETLAYAIEEAVKAGIKPLESKGVLGAWLSRIANGFRKLLTKFGMSPESLDAQGLVDMAFGAAQMEMRPAPTGMSRRMFLRGAVAAVGGMKLPPIKAGLSLNAKADLFNATLDAADSWFNVVRGMAKTPALREMLEDYSFSIDNPIFAEALYDQDPDVTDNVYNHLHWRDYGPGDFEESLMDLLESKPDAIEKLQGAILDVRSQLVSMIDKLPKKENGEIAENELPEVGDLLFSRAAKYGVDNALTQLAQDAVFDGSNSTEKVMDNAALRFEMNYVDMRAALRKVLDIGAKAFGDSRLFQQAMFSYTDADQKMSLTYAALNEGYLKLTTDSKGFKFIESSGKESAKDVFVATGNIPNKYGDEAGKVGLATAYMAAQRAANKGLSKLDLDALGLTEEKMAAALAAADADPELKNALEKVRETYNAYNEGMVRMVQDSGAISKAFADELLKDKDYVPYYRVRPDGTAVLVLGNDRTITVGDIKHQPWLRELKGGETKILPITQSIPRNTMLLVSMATSNMARRNFAYAMQEIGRGQGEVDPRTGEARNLMSILSGKGPDDPSIIRFKQEPDPNKKDDKGDRYIRIQTKGTVAEGVPAELIIKSMEGAPLTLPAFLKWGGIAGDILRKGVTRMPMYLIRQLFRDPMAAAATSGLDYGMFTAVYKANKEFLKMTFAESKTASTMLKKGLIQSGVFTGDPDDVETMALQLVSGKDFNIINKVCREADKLAMNADAATRSLVYENAIKNGMSEAEAKFAVQESMNFHKRGLSAGTQYLSRMIPFFNAQIQGLNVLYKAGSGQMPFEQQLQIKQKFYNNALFLVAGGLAYAMAMQDDEYYKNAKPKDRYSNFFLHTPFTDEPLKLPIPYEFGWFFSMGAAAADAMAGETDGTQQLKALQSMLVGAIPGSSSMGMPQILKPFAEVWANKDFNTGFALESTRLRGKSTEERYNANTTELAKAMSQFAPVLSPIQIERIVGGYLGPLPILVAAATNGLFKDGDVEPVPKNMSEMPFIGSGFQKKYGGADSDVMYRLADEALQAKRDFDSMKREGRIADAQEYVQDHRIELRVAPLALQYQKLMGNFRTMEERIKGADIPGDEKRKRIDDIQKRRQELAEKFENRIKELAT